tara:strand:+ start:259 stop:2601 length:2343 start_codon:yes stop_codon:yes gene_type:complete
MPREEPVISAGHRWEQSEIWEFMEASGKAMTPLLRAAAEMRDFGHGSRITFSKNAFIPLTHLCRNVCHYCTFAERPVKGCPAFMSAEQVIEIARRSAAAGCKEILLTLGDKPELRYSKVRQELEMLGHKTTISYLTEVAGLILQETGLLPHLNPGVVEEDELRQLRGVSVSQGLMLETTAERLCERGGPHFGSPDKHPTKRLETIEAAGRCAVPFTTGLLIGIGETREERIDALLRLREINDRYDHIQELIIQNFKPKSRTLMSEQPEPHADELRWTIAVARLLFGPEMNIQAPPNLLSGELVTLIDAGINDWGGISPVTQDFVNPEAPWPSVERLEDVVSKRCKNLCERLATYPRYVVHHDQWLDKAVIGPTLALTDGEGLARDSDWFAGDSDSKSFGLCPSMPMVWEGGYRIHRILDRSFRGDELEQSEVESLLTTRGNDFRLVCEAANELRQQVAGDNVTYVVNCNINYTNICTFRCTFCAFSKKTKRFKGSDAPYKRELSEILEMARQAVDNGATEVCLQGGIHPSYSGEWYLEVAQSIHTQYPDLHIHAFSPLEVWHGAETMGLPVEEFLVLLKEAGLKTLPGTAAEILDDEIRAVLCPDKLNRDLWLKIVSAAHRLEMPTTATLMFGHVERPKHIATHLLDIRNLQRETGGFSEFIPLPFVHMQAPIWLKGKARRGPTFREAVVVHAVSRLVLNPYLKNIQVSWTKMGVDGAKYCLNAGANDLGGTLMRESISRAAGATHGQEFGRADMRHLIHSIGRQPTQRTTRYELVEHVA